jgi:hypothetical protein
MYLLKWIMFALQALATKHADMKIVCSPIRYAAVVKHLLEKHKYAIKDIGFKGLLHMHSVHLRRMMLVGCNTKKNIRKRLQS